MAKIFLTYFDQLETTLERLDLSIILAHNKIVDMLNKFQTSTLPLVNIENLETIMNTLTKMTKLKYLKTNIAHQFHYFGDKQRIQFKLPSCLSLDEFNLTDINESSFNVEINSNYNCLHWLSPLYDVARFLNFTGLINFFKSMVSFDEKLNNSNFLIQMNTLSLDISSSCTPLNISNKEFKDNSLIDFLNFILGSRYFKINSLNIRLKCKQCYVKEKMKVTGFENCAFTGYFTGTSMNFIDYCKLIGFQLEINSSNISRILVYKKSITNHRLPMGYQIAYDF